MPCPGDPGPRPTFIPAYDCCRTVMQYEIFGQTVENVHYFRQSGGFTGEELDALNSSITTAWAANLRPLLPPQATLQQIISTAQEVPSGVQDTDIVAVAGSNADDSINALNATLAIKFSTGQSGRSYRGRMYWPALVGVEVLDNEVSSSYVNDIVSALESFFGAIFSDVGAQHVIVSYQQDCEWLTTAVSTFVTGYGVADRHVDSQRRRLSGRGI